ncbi:uncharacterized protein LOC127871701 isoform X1 [Dreissena polymorpha]|uniref:uncharacterized protein LOC127871701 isoform X1 n=1 Tax=Dreissena polymorpha TaxID=45954 RepID=UPI002264D881|nr:uncharacterized protein LOC127871701 isoform X1 [Dreissena polymorpha]
MLYKTEDHVLTSYTFLTTTKNTAAMMLMLIAAVFVQVLLTTGHAMSVTGLDDNVSAMEQLLTMVPERTTDNFPLKEMYQQLQTQLKSLEDMYQQQQKQLKILEERKEQRNGPSDYATTVNVNKSEVVVGSQAYPRVAFTALKVASQPNIYARTRITFEKVILNVGNAYRAGSGTFVVPTCGSGIYMFSFTLAAPQGIYSALFHNGGEIARINLPSSAWISGTQTVFVNLNANDQVWVQSMGYNARGVYGMLESSFTGILVA